jgi:hypothetical protein
MLPTEDKEYYKIKIRDNYEIEVRPWLGKDLRNFPSIINEETNIAELEDPAIYELVTPCIKDFDNIYLNRDELLYILYYIRMISLKKEYNYTIECNTENCDGVIEGHINIENCDYTPMDTSVIEVNGDKIDMSAKTDITMYYENSDYKDIGILLHINNINGKEHSISELKDYIDNMNADDYINFVQQFIDNRSFFEVYSENKCEKCGKEYLIELDELPNFLYY